MGFQCLQTLTNASSAVLANGTSFPASVGNGAILTGYPARNISTVISTAGDLSQSQVLVNLVGTEIGSDGKTSYPFPLSINLTNSGYTCSNPSSYTGEFSSFFDARPPYLPLSFLFFFRNSSSCSCCYQGFCFRMIPFITTGSARNNFLA